MKKSTHTREYATFIAALREVRVDAGITQVQLAKKLRSTQSIVSKCERGERRLDVIELRRWLAALGTTLTVFADKLDDELGHTRRSG